LKKENQDLSLFKPIQKAIINKFNTDPNIVDLNRILRIPNYLHLKDPSNPFRIKCIKFDSHLRYTQHEIADALQCDLQIIQNNISKKIEANIKENKVLEEKCKPSVLKEVTDIVVLKEWENKEFNTIEDIVDYLRRQDMGEVLGIKSEPNVAFRCIFHDDNHPSAVITNKQGVYKYFCNSPICKFHNENGLDIIDIVCKMKSITFIEAVKYLCQKFSIEMPDERWKKSQEEKYIQNLNRLFDKSFLQQYKSLNKTIRWGIRVLAEINQIGLENITFDKFSLDGQNIFFFSNRYLAGRLGMNVKQANQYINLFCALKLINKVPKEDVPEALLDNAKEIAKKQGQRMINFYTVSSLGEVIQKSDEMANKMLKKGYSSIKTVSKVLIQNIFDEQVAGDIYKGCESSSFTRKVQDLIESYVLEEIMKKGYVILDDIYDKQIIIDGEVVEKENKYINYKRLIPVLIDKYNFEYRKANKELLQRFGLKGYSYVLYKKTA